MNCVKDSIFNTTLSSSKDQINSLLEEKEIDINIDYSDLSNFIHFSSAQTRLENFALIPAAFVPIIENLLFEILTFFLFPLLVF